MHATTTTPTTTTARRPVIQPRTPRLEFDESIPRHWLAGSPVMTHIANGVNLLFPAGERFFVRSVRHYLDRIEDPELRAQVVGFCGQEGRHARAHEDFFEILAAQGYDVATFLRVYNKVAYDWIERATSPELRLSATVALEHFTAILAEDALTLGLLDQHAHPTMAKLLQWHAAEEIEHKAVAFDVLARVAPSYRLRMAGLAIGAVCLAGFWLAATITLLTQDGPDARRGARAAAPPERRSLLRGVFLRGVREYVRRDFHPSQNDNYHLAQDYLAAAGYVPPTAPAPA